MTAPAPLYDLTLILDPQSEESTRAKVLEDTRAAISASGELVRDDDWGERALTYPIKRRKTAEYHLLQFHVGDKALLSGLERTLHITDGVLRFRLIKLKPGVGAPPDMRSSSTAPRRSPEESRAEDEERAASPGDGEQAGPAAAEAPDASTVEPAASTVEPAAEPQASAGEEAAQAQASAGEQAAQPQAGEEAPAGDEQAEQAPASAAAEQVDEQ